MRNSVFVPVGDGERAVELSALALPRPENTVALLGKANAPIPLWIDLALDYYRSGQISGFLSLLKAAATREGELDARIAAINANAAHFGVLAVFEKRDSEAQKAFFAQAANELRHAEQLDFNSRRTQTTYGAIALARGDIVRALQRFTVAVGGAHEAPFVPAMIGLACALYHQKRFHDALKQYRAVLEVNPVAPANVRLGLAMCFYALGRTEPAREAFERVLELDPHSADALTGLAVLRLNAARANRSDTNAVAEGMALVQRAYKADPESPAALVLLANHFFFCDELDNAIKFARKAYDVASENATRAEASFQEGRAHHARGEWTQAHERYQTTVALNNDHLVAQFGLGQVYLHQGNADKALACFEVVHTAQPDNWDAMFMVGVLMANRSLTAAQKLLQKCTTVRPSDARAWLHLAEICHHKHDMAGALRAYRRGVEQLREAGVYVRPELYNNIGALGLLVEAGSDESCRSALLAVGAYVEAGAPGVDAPFPEREHGIPEETLLATGQAFVASLVAQTRAEADVIVQEVEDDVAEKLAKEAANIAKKKREMRAAQAEKEGQGDNQGNGQDGSQMDEDEEEEDNVPSGPSWLQELRKTNARKSADAGKTVPFVGSLLTAVYNYARACDGMGRTAEAADCYLAIIVRHPYYPDALVRMGVMARDAGALDHAHVWWNRVYTVAKGHAETRCFQGNLHLQRGRYKAAKTVYEMIPQKKGAMDEYAMVAQGNIYFIASINAPKGKDLDKAFACFSEVLKVNPRNVCAINGMATVLAQKGYFAAAKDLFVQIRQTSGEHVAVWLNLAHMHMRQGQWGTARKLYSNASRKFFNDTDPQVLLWLSRAFFEDNKFDKAKEVLLSALQLRPQDPTLRFNHALALESHAVASLHSTTLSLSEARDALSELDEARVVFQELSNKENKLNVELGTVVGSVARAQMAAKIVSRSARHARYCESTRVEVEKRVALAEEAEKERLIKVAQVEAERAAKEAARLAAEEAIKAKAEADKLAVEQALAEQEAKNAAMREQWDAAALNKRKRKAVRSDDVDPDLEGTNERVQGRIDYGDGEMPLDLPDDDAPEINESFQGDAVDEATRERARKLQELVAGYSAPNEAVEPPKTRRRLKRRKDDDEDDAEEAQPGIPQNDGEDGQNDGEDGQNDGEDVAVDE